MSAVSSTPAASETGLKTFIDPVQLNKDIAINPTDLDNAMLAHSGLSVHYGIQAVHARSQAERMKNAVEILEARLDNEYRDSLKAEGAKVTEGAIKAAVLNDKRYSAAQNKLIEAQTIYRLAEVAANAFSGRKDLILEVARDRRKEREGELRVMAVEAAKESASKAVREMMQGKGDAKAA